MINLKKDVGISADRLKDWLTFLYNMSKYSKTLGNKNLEKNCKEMALEISNKYQIELNKDNDVDIVKIIKDNFDPSTIGVGFISNEIGWGWI